VVADHARVWAKHQSLTLPEHDLAAKQLRRDRIGLVFQQFNLIPSLDVKDNLAFQSRIAGCHDAAWQSELVDRLGLGGLLNRYPEQLSGGQQQRVAIGRALAVKPALLLADEPTGNLDSKNGRHVFEMMVEMNRRRSATLVLVTHDHELAAMADRQIALREGRVSSDSHAAVDSPAADTEMEATR